MIEDWQQFAYFSWATTGLWSALFKFGLKHWYNISSTLGILTTLDCLHLVDGIWLGRCDDHQWWRYHFTFRVSKPVVGGYLLLTLLGRARMMNHGFCYYYPVCSAIPYLRVDFASLPAPWTSSWMIQDWQKSAYFSWATISLHTGHFCFLRYLWFWFGLGSSL